VEAFPHHVGPFRDFPSFVLPDRNLVERFLARNLVECFLAPRGGYFLPLEVLRAEHSVDASERSES
jgi:hypothetical protein